MEIKAKKSLGQHFLASKQALDRIISASSIEPGEEVLEIGPGTGILTAALIAAGAKVTAVEKDERAAALLNEKLSEDISAGRLKLVQGDVLETSPMMDGKFAIVANIPYYITGAILETFLERGPRPTRMILLVQKEVAERIIAADGKESVLSISVKAFGTPRIAARVPRGAFVPPPKVDSAVISVSSIGDQRFSDAGLQPDLFFRAVKAGFAHKRKLLIRNLEAICPKEKLEGMWLELGLDKKARAEDIGVETWFDIASKIAAGL
ncbi:MAG: ribosomal RNA small subunit methyltransferase A [Patescibacteria group bacterium]|nr:ribosomal RNA small subunit methyltransferase A [Patescibacteria group bacterium]MDE1966844.1 ribosomal RNA small subunit methyltransferase A [Patescibacteria group bacterium]